MDDYLLYAFSFFTTLLLVSAAAISVYVRTVPDFSYMALALVYYHLFQIPGAVAKCAKQWHNRQKLFRNVTTVAHHVAFAVSIGGVALFLFGVLSGPIMFYLAIGNVLVQVVRYTCTNYAEELVVSLPFLNLVTAMCLMMLAIRLESPANHAAWGFVLLWYYLFYYFSMIVLISLITCGLLFLYFSLFDPAVFEEVEPAKAGLTVVLGSALFLLLLSVCALLSGVKAFLELGLVGPHPRPQSMPSLLFKAAIFAAGYSLVMTVAVLALRLFYRDSLIKKLFKVEGKTISFKTYFQNLKLRIRRVGSNYFVKRGATEAKEPEYSVKAGDLNLGDSDKCMVCCEAQVSILLQPCKHYVFCEPCLVEYLKTKSVCPMDKTKIDKALVMFFDAEKGEYFATKSIKVSEEAH